MGDISSQETNSLPPEMEGRVKRANEAFKGKARAEIQSEPVGLVTELSRYLLPAVDKFKDKSLLSVACGHFVEGSVWAATTGANAYGVDIDGHNFPLGEGFANMARMDGAIDPNVKLVTKEADATTSEAYQFPERQGQGKFNIVMMRHPHLLKYEDEFSAITQRSVYDGLAVGGIGYTTFYSDKERNTYMAILKPLVDAGVIQMGITNADGQIVLPANGAEQFSSSSHDELIVGFTKLRESPQDEQVLLAAKIQKDLDDRHRMLSGTSLSMKDLAK